MKQLLIVLLAALLTPIDFSPRNSQRHTTSFVLADIKPLIATSTSPVTQPQASLLALLNDKSLSSDGQSPKASSPFSTTTDQVILADSSSAAAATSVINPCFKNNGNCQYLCVLTAPLSSATAPSAASSSPAYRCACPVGKQLDKNLRSCIQVDEYLLYSQQNFIRGIILNNGTLTPSLTYNPTTISHSNSRSARKYAST